MGGDRPRAVVLRALGLGDALTAVPALRALDRALPDHELVLLSPGWLRPIAEAAVPRMHLEPLARLTGDLPGVSGADVLVNLHGSGPASNVFGRSLHPARIVAFADPRTGVTGPQWRAEEHEVDRWCRLIASTWDVPTLVSDLLLSPPPMKERDPYVVIHVGASAPARRWFPRRFAAVADGLLERGWDVVLTGGPAERARAKAIASAVPRVDASQVGATDLTALCALVAGASLVIAGDTGVSHLATAYARPSVTLFGPMAPARWGPRTDGPHTVLWHGQDVPGTPSAPHIDARLAAITVGEVLDASLALLAFGAERPRVPAARGVDARDAPASS